MDASWFEKEGVILGGRINCRIVVLQYRATEK